MNTIPRGFASGLYLAAPATAVLALLAVLLAGSGCDDCLVAPTSDSSPPNTSMLITYTSLTNHKETKLVSGLDQATTIAANKDRPVGVRYNGQDPQGMRLIYLDASIVKDFGAVQQRQDASIAPTTLSCPKELVTHSTEFPGGQGARTLSMKATSENWMGGKTTTPTVIVQQQ